MAKIRVNIGLSFRNGIAASLPTSMTDVYPNRYSRDVEKIGDREPTPSVFENERPVATDIDRYFV